MRKPAVFLSLSQIWTVVYTDSDSRVLTWHDCDSWAHALRVANRIARRQARESA